jgi:hypothetical protein
VCPTIPGEDERELQQLHSALIAEWRPSGPTEEDAVHSLADLMWRKRRAQRYIQTKLKTEIFVASSPFYCERRSLALFACFMDHQPKLLSRRPQTSYLVPIGSATWNKNVRG